MNLPLVAQPGERALDIIQKPSSSLSLRYIASGPPEMESSMTIRIFLESGASLESFYSVIGGKNAKFMVETHLNGDGARLEEKTIFFGNGDQYFEMVSATLMKGKNTEALVQSKGILADQARARFDGMIHIFQAARGACARLNEHTLLLSSEAKMNAIPGLKIETNEVAATHAASMTRVDDEQLFYTGSRGVDEREATRLIAEGFLAGAYRDLPEMEIIYPLIREKICLL